MLTEHLDIVFGDLVNFLFFFFGEFSIKNFTSKCQLVVSSKAVALYDSVELKPQKQINKIFMIFFWNYKSNWFEW